jgi:hypothetical protein
MPKISVCIPTHNMANKDFFLERALHSVRMQTFQDFEIVVTEHGKMAENTNFAIKKATGTLVKILYMDDWLAHPNALEEIWANFEFTDNLGMMRVIRTFISLQVIGLIIDNPTIELPIVFQILCRTFCFYSIRFYSRPFLDALYCLQYFSVALNKLYVHMTTNDKQARKAKIHIGSSIVDETSYSVYGGHRKLLATTG